VLTVADVVEAMTHFRPYRPGLGLEVALAEIRSRRGTRFDPDVVDACVAAFETGAFQWSPAHRVTDWL
jgi:HD-GYP domain-containing protein (c-di-GMP phosphodiesterase class II)